MLDCKKKRLDYGEELRPPVGYQFDRALAATYSANLDTLLSLPVALMFGQTLEGDLAAEQVEMWEAIRDFSNRVRVYHQKGQLHVPKRSNWLHVHLEDALVPVLPQSEFSSFHPKVWVIRYVPEEEEGRMAAPESEELPAVRYRLLVMSRNLTFDRSWDIAASLDGVVGERRKRRSKGLSDFVKWLSRKDPGQPAWVNQIVDEIPFVDFETPPDFESHRFYPMGIPGYRNCPTGEIESRRSLVMSPFIDESVVQKVRDQTEREVSVFGEAFELNRLGEEIREEVDAYVLSDLIVEGERNALLEENSRDEQLQNLHAKLFVFREGKTTRWFFGSANATNAARERNVEFMIELAGTGRYSSIHQLQKSLLGEDGVWPFHPHRYADEVVDDEAERTLSAAARRFEYALLKSTIEARVERVDESKNWDLVVHFDLGKVPHSAEFRLTVAPFNLKNPLRPVPLSPGKKGGEELRFRNVGELELSRFLIFKIENAADKRTLHEFLLRIDIAGLPRNRLANILRRVINSPDKFFRYLQFLLEEEVPREALTEPGSESVSLTSGNDADFSDWIEGVPLFERLLVIASRSPSRLRDLDKVIRELNGEDEEQDEDQDHEDRGEAVVPERFLRFWEPFRQLIPGDVEK